MPRAFTALERQNIRDRLLIAARSAIARQGLRRTPVSALSRAVGISKGAFYQFFESKEDLCAAVLLETETELRGQLSAAATPREVLQILFRSVVHHPMLSMLADPQEMIWLTRGVGPERMTEARADDDAFFTELFGRLQAEGLLDAELDLHVLAGIPGAALALAQGHPIIGPERAEAVTDLIVEGLVARTTSG